MINLPKPPALLYEDLPNDWRYFSSSLELIGSLSGREASNFADFEAKFKMFLYGGVSVQRIAPDASLNSSGFGNSTDSLERRTLWLMLPESGSLRLGYVSKKKSVDADDRSLFSEAISEGGATNASDEQTAADESTIGGNTLDSRSTFQGSRVGRVKMSKKYSMALSDVALLKRISNVSSHGILLYILLPLNTTDLFNFRMPEIPMTIQLTGGLLLLKTKAGMYSNLSRILCARPN